MTQRNTELLQQTMQYIKDHPEQHNQAGYWTECGTPSCFAGWALHLNGVTQRQVYNHPFFNTGNYAAFFNTGNYAATVLGLALTEGITLFHPGNTVPMLELMVKDLVNGDALRGWEDYRREANE